MGSVREVFGVTTGLKKDRPVASLSPSVVPVNRLVGSQSIKVLPTEHRFSFTRKVKTRDGVQLHGAHKT